MLTEFRPRIYIAGPLNTGGRTMEAIKQAVTYADFLMSYGFAPYIPHLAWFWNLMSPCVRTEKQMLEFDFIWLRQCSALLRLPGGSRGADLEVAYAKEHAIPVFFDVDDLLNSFKR